jgi:hypothetical protein
MFDKFITDYINKGTVAQTAVKEQLGQVSQAGEGIEGVRKKYGVKFKEGGVVSRGQKKARSKTTKLF